jgi:hypothetical protein
MVVLLSGLFVHAPGAEHVQPPDERAADLSDLAAIVLERVPLGRRLVAEAPRSNRSARNESRSAVRADGVDPDLAVGPLMDAVVGVGSVAVLSAHEDEAGGRVRDPSDTSNGSVSQLCRTVS